MTTTITSSGTGSGLDFESIIEASVEAKRTTLESKTTVAKEEANIELSGVSQLKSALETFQEALQAFTEDDAFNAHSISIDQDDVTYYTVTADDDVSNMTYDIIVEQLASSEKISKTLEITEDNNQFQAGTLTFTMTDDSGNEVSFSIEVEEGDTLELIRRKINENEYGLTANYVKTDSGYILTIDTGTTGSANNSLTITATVDGEAAEGYQSLSSLAFSGGTTDEDGNVIDGWNYTAAKDAIIQVDGQRVSSSTNTFDEQISGITLTVAKVSATDDDGNFIANTLTITQDYDAVTTKMEEFVSAYNTLMSTLDELYERNTYTDGVNNYDGGDLAGNSTLRTLQNAIKNLVSSAGINAETGQSIYSMGLVFESDGTLSLDSDDFKEALSSNFNLVVNAFSGEDGLLQALDDMIEEYTKTAGILDEWADQLESEISDLELEEAENEEYLEQYEASLRTKYGNLDSYLANINTALSILLAAV